MKALKHLFALLAVSSAATFAWAGCSADVGDESSAGDEDAITSTKCKVVDARDGHTMSAAELKKLNDPIALKIIGGAKGKCPTSFQDSVAKLGETDNKSCQASGGNIGPLPPIHPPPGAQFALTPKSADGNSTRFVSDRSQVLGKADSYRAVVTRECDGRSDHEMFISLFGIQAGDEDMPNDFEAIGKDKVSGVFNYYAREEGKWTFFGNSLDLIGDGYDCKDNGACTPKAAVKTRCASCHIGGGLNMKELNSPWVHWEGDTQTPGTDDMMTKHKHLLGTKGNGIDLENKVSSGNQEYTPKRVAFLKTKGVEEVLRPLFCTLDINLHNADGSTTLKSFSAADLLTKAIANHTVETWLSGPALSVEFTRVSGRKLTGLEVAALAQQGDFDANALLARYEERLAKALAHLVNVLDPDIIVLGGGLSNLDRLYKNVAPKLVLDRSPD